MTPAEEVQARRDASIKRARRIDALDAGQLANFIHRLAAIEPAQVDRVLGEFDANMPKPRTEPKLHPVRFESTLVPIRGLIAYCELAECRDADWHVHVEDGHGLPELERLVREHSGITS